MPKIDSPNTPSLKPLDTPGMPTDKGGGWWSSSSDGGNFVEPVSLEDVAAQVAGDSLEGGGVPPSKEEESVTKIAAAWKGYKARKAYKIMLEEKTKSERNGAAVRIQAAVRGFLARKSYAHIREICAYTDRVKDQLTYFHRILVGSEIQVEENFQHCAIRPRDRDHSLSEIRRTVDFFKYVQDCLNDDLSDPEVLELPELFEKYGELLHDLEAKIYKMSKKTGLASIEGMLESHLGEFWQDIFPKKSLEILEELSFIARPVEAKLIDLGKVSSKIVVLTDKRRPQIKDHDFNGDLARSIPLVRKLNFLDGGTTEERLNCGELIVPMPDGESAMVIKISFKLDPIGAASAGGWLGARKDELIAASRRVDLPSFFKRKFISNMRPRDIAVADRSRFGQDLKDAYKALRDYKDQSMLRLIQLALNAKESKLVEVFSLLLLDDEGKKRAVALMRFVENEIPSLMPVLMDHLSYQAQKTLKITRKELDALFASRERVSAKDMSFSQQIDLLKMNDLVDRETIEKLEEKEELSHEHGSDGSKATTWLKRALKIPYGEYVADTVDREASREEKLACLAGVREKLDDAVYGHDDAKDMIEEVVAQWIQNKGSNGSVIAIQGPPGNGKTTLAREGIAKALGRPFVSMAFGGATDGTILKGHSETYVGSKPGRIVELIMEAGCMNPVIYIDELDKISKTAKGDEIVGILTHLLDPSQNHEFQDDYFAGLKIDLSKCLFVLSYNDDNKIEGIMGDRLTVIHTDGLRPKDKVAISHKYMMPGILREVGFEENEVTIEDDVVEFIISGYTFEAGARKLKEKLYKLVRRINVRCLHDPSMVAPYKITEELVREVLGSPKEMDLKISPTPEVGVANGLFYTAAGLGGIGPIQVGLKPSYRWGGCQFTREMERTTSESLDVAETVAWDLIPQELVDDIKEESAKSFHVFRSIGVDEEISGGHVGAAVTTAIVSTLMGIQVNNKVAITGGVDLKGNVTKTDGLKMMIIGAKRAGCTKVLVPRACKDELRDLKEKQPELFRDRNFKIVKVRHMKEVISHSLLVREFIQEKKAIALEERKLAMKQRK